MIIYPHGSVIFCDDLRQETNGKLLLIGVYNEDILFTVSPPWTLAGLWCLVKYHEPFPEIMPNLSIKVRLITSKGVEDLMDLPQETPDVDGMPLRNKFAFETDSIRMLALSATIRLPPTVFQEEAKLSVVMTRDDDEIFLGRVRISQFTPPKT